MILLLAAVALAGEPTRPVLDEAAVDACPAMDIRAKTPYTSPCDALAISLAQAVWFAEMAVYADELHDLRRLDTVSLEAQLKYANDRSDFYKGIAEKPPQALKIVPAGWFGMGVGAGVIAVLGGAIAVRWASEVPVTTTAE